MITEISISHFLIGKSQNSRIKVLLVARFKSVTLSIHVNQCSSFVPTSVVCDPPCENGACVANDTCNCADGYEGERCTDRGEFATSSV